jgi:hypothetical protein
MVLSTEELMKKKNAVDQTLIRRLRAAGCPMPGDWEDDPQPDLTIAVSRPEVTRAHCMRGWVEYVFAILIRNLSYEGLKVEKFDCCFDWPTRLTWLGDPRIYSPEKQVYRLPGSGREFPYEMVLNHRTGRLGNINPGETLEGICLAFRECRGLPDECFVGSVIQAELSIVDQHGREHVSEIKVEVDLTATITPRMLMRRPGQGLYGPTEPRTTLAVGEHRRCETPPPALSSTEPWWNYDGEPARLRQTLVDADATAQE